MARSGVKFGRKMEDAIAALLSQRNVDEAARSAGNVGDFADRRRDAFIQDQQVVVRIERHLIRVERTLS